MRVSGGICCLIPFGRNRFRMPAAKMPTADRMGTDPTLVLPQFGSNQIALTIPDSKYSSPGVVPCRNSATVKMVAIYVTLAALVWAVFGQTLGHGFVEYDDQNYVYQNPRITAGLTFTGFASAFRETHARNWHPLTTISHMMDC